MPPVTCWAVRFPPFPLEFLSTLTSLVSYDLYPKRLQFSPLLPSPLCKPSPVRPSWRNPVPTPCSPVPCVLFQRPTPKSILATSHVAFSFSPTSFRMQRPRSLELSCPFLPFECKATATFSLTPLKPQWTPAPFVFNRPRASRRR